MESGNALEFVTIKRVVCAEVLGGASGGLYPPIQLLRSLFWLFRHIYKPLKNRLPYMSTLCYHAYSQRYKHWLLRWEESPAGKAPRAHTVDINGTQIDKEYKTIQKPLRIMRSSRERHCEVAGWKKNVIRGSGIRRWRAVSWG